MEKQGERRDQRDWTDKGPLIAEALLALPVTSATIERRWLGCRLANAD